MQGGLFAGALRSSHQTRSSSCTGRACRNDSTRFCSHARCQRCCSVFSLRVVTPFSSVLLVAILLSRFGSSSSFSFVPCRLRAHSDPSGSSLNRRVRSSRPGGISARPELHRRCRDYGGRTDSLRRAGASFYEWAVESASERPRELCSVQAGVDEPRLSCPRAGARRFESAHLPLERTIARGRARLARRSLSTKTLGTARKPAGHIQRAAGATLCDPVGASARLLRYSLFCPLRPRLSSRLAGTPAEARVSSPCAPSSLSPRARRGSDARYAVSCELAAPGSTLRSN